MKVLLFLLLSILVSSIPVKSFIESVGHLHNVDNDDTIVVVPIQHANEELSGTTQIEREESGTGVASTVKLVQANGTSDPNHNVSVIQGDELFITGDKPEHGLMQNVIMEKWPSTDPAYKGVIKFKYEESGGTSSDLYKLMMTIDYLNFHFKGCLKFQKVDSDYEGNDYTNIYMHKNNIDQGWCSSTCGYKPGENEVILGGCTSGSVVHELLHTIGMFHNQQRGDLRDYAKLNLTGLDDGWAAQYRQKRGDQYKDIGKFDFNSIMQYPSHFKGADRIVPKTKNKKEKERLIKEMGQRERMSSEDFKKVKKHYGCPNIYKGMDSSWINIESARPLNTLCENYPQICRN